MSLLFSSLRLAVFHDGDPHSDGLCVYELYSKNKCIPFFSAREALKDTKTMQNWTREGFVFPNL